MFNSNQIQAVAAAQRKLKELARYVPDGITFGSLEVYDGNKCIGTLDNDLDAGEYLFDPGNRGDEWEVWVYSVFGNSNKIPAIKEVRGYFEYGLKEAKETVEQRAPFLVGVLNNGDMAQRVAKALTSLGYSAEAHNKSKV